MSSKKKYFKLDEIGFVGTQQKVSMAQQKQDAILTAKIIKAGKAGKVISIPKTVNIKRKAV
jgi:hypothetical protein